MTQPRRHIAGQVVHLNRRCFQRKFFLRPDSFINRVLFYETARYSKRHGQVVHGAMAMSNHIHQIATDTTGERSDYMRDAMREISPRLLYEVGYCGRGRCEQWIGEYKNGLFGDRISCHEFEANGFRTMLAALAYQLMFFIQTQLRRLAEHQQAPAETVERCRQMARPTFGQLRLRFRTASSLKQSRPYAPRSR